MNQELDRDFPISSAGDSFAVTPMNASTHMFEFFNRSTGATSEAVRVDRNLINERLATALVDAGLDADGKIYLSIFKMISDDLDWYFENLDEHDLG